MLGIRKFSDPVKNLIKTTLGVDVEPEFMHGRNGYELRFDFGKAYSNGIVYGMKSKIYLPDGYFVAINMSCDKPIGIVIGGKNLTYLSDITSHFNEFLDDISECFKPKLSSTEMHCIA